MTTLKSESGERQLIEAAQKDRRRFAELYEQNFERVYAFVARRVRERAVAEDLTSEVFHRALETLPRYEWRGVPFAAWLLRIARNAVNDHWQRAGREQGQPSPEASEEPVSLEEVERRATLFRLVDTHLPTSAGWFWNASWSNAASVKLPTRWAVRKARSSSFSSAHSRTCACA